MANLTLSIDDDILQRAREAALRERTSVNALVREFLRSYADSRSRRLQALDTFDAIAGLSEVRELQPWSRDQLHQR